MRCKYAVICLYMFACLTNSLNPTRFVLTSSGVTVVSFSVEFKPVFEAAGVVPGVFVPGLIVEE